MIYALLEKMKSAMHNAECLYCRQKMTGGVDICEFCLDKLGFREPTPLVHQTNLQTHSATVFNAMIKKLIYGYKFFGKSEHQRLLAILLIKYWENYGAELYDPALTWVVFVPPHGKRHPHMAAITRKFAAHFGYIYKPEVLNWRFDVKAQRTLNGRQERYNNVDSCMVVRSPHIDNNPAKQPDNVIIIDDITTTGATLCEATQAFYRTNWFDNDIDYNQIVGLTITSVPIAFQGTSSQVVS